MEWISVEDRLPEIDQQVLVVVDKGNNPQDKTIHKLLYGDYPEIVIGHGWVSDINIGGDEGNWIEVRSNKKHTVCSQYCNADHVTHWMPLPPPPL